MKKKKVLTLYPRMCIVSQLRCVPIVRLIGVLWVILLFTSPVFTQTGPVWRVNQGYLTVNGEFFHVWGGSWTGLEGHYDDVGLESYGFAPIEMFIGNMWWAESGRTYEQDILEFASMGFNLIRLPVAPQTLDPNTPEGRDPYLKNTEAVRIENSRLALETVMRLLDDAGIYVLLNIYSCSNYVGWRAGRLDARPPYPDRDWDNYDYTRENCSCSEDSNSLWVDTIQAYDKDKWLADLRELAGLGAQLGVTNIMGIDIFNEPWDYTWDEWKSLIEQAYEAINAVNPNILIFAQGISASAGNQAGPSGTFTWNPHGAEETIPGRGENLYEAVLNPPSVPMDRLVFSPHVYGPSKYVQKQFMDPDQRECEGLEGDAAGDAQCNIVIDPALLEQGWEEHFGYLVDYGYAVVIGEFGGNFDWPRYKTERRDHDRYSYLTGMTLDWQWQCTFLNYLVYRGIRDTIYWAINPESRDTGGVYSHAYDPITNTAGWGTWTGIDTRKRDMLYTFWLGNPPPPPPTPTPALPPPSNLGDVNADNAIDIIDALMTAQYYVGLAPAGFIARNADVDCDDSTTIIDALLIAQYYVGLLNPFGC